MSGSVYRVYTEKVGQVCAASPSPSVRLIRGTAPPAVGEHWRRASLTSYMSVLFFEVDFRRFRWRSSSEPSLESRSSSTTTEWAKSYWFVQWMYCFERRNGGSLLYISSVTPSLRQGITSLSYFFTKRSSLFTPGDEGALTVTNRI